MYDPSYKMSSSVVFKTITSSEPSTDGCWSAVSFSSYIFCFAAYRRSAVDAPWSPRSSTLCLIALRARIQRTDENKGKRYCREGEAHMFVNEFLTKNGSVKGFCYLWPSFFLVLLLLLFQFGLCTEDNYFRLDALRTGASAKNDAQTGREGFESPILPCFFLPLLLPPSSSGKKNWDEAAGRWNELVRSLVQLVARRSPKFDSSG